MRALVCDTRQQAGKHDVKEGAWRAAGVRLVRSKLPWGDYAAPPAVAVDTKRDVYELAADIDHGHERFKRECVGAAEAGCALYVLVENEQGVRTLADLAGWRETDAHLAMRRRRSKNPNARRIEGARLAKACATMGERYGVRFEFCRPEEAAARVVELVEGGAARGRDEGSGA